METNKDMNLVLDEVMSAVEENPEEAMLRKFFQGTSFNWSVLAIIHYIIHHYQIQ